MLNAGPRKRGGERWSSTPRGVAAREAIEREVTERRRRPEKERALPSASVPRRQNRDCTRECKWVVRGAGEAPWRQTRGFRSRISDESLCRWVVRAARECVRRAAKRVSARWRSYPLSAVLYVGCAPLTRCATPVRSCRTATAGQISSFDF